MTEALTVTDEDVYEALEEVIDPELGLDFVSLGLVYDVEIENNSEVYVTFTLTTPACPIGPQVSEQMKEFVGDIDGVSNVHPKMVFDPPWSPEMMSAPRRTSAATGAIPPARELRPRPRGRTARFRGPVGRAPAARRGRPSRRGR
jgi:metal-sulfur cluster biosynthetic enzyme